MSTIKSSDEHLTLNADGSSKDIKFQANGVEKASISSSGAFTSTTIDATKLTGNLPALNASALTNLDAADVSGTHTNFTSTGIDDNADATTITIDSNETVLINGSTSPTVRTGGNNSTGDCVITAPALGDNALTLKAPTSHAAGVGVDIVGLNFAANNYYGGSGKSGIYYQIMCENGNGSYSDRGQLRFTPGYDGNIQSGQLEKSIIFSYDGDMFMYDFDSGGGSKGIRTDDNCRIKFSNSGSSTQEHLRFYNSNGLVGQIHTNGSSTTFQTSSDYRLKENVDYTWDATTRLKQLKPARFNFIADDSVTVDGFLAHEVSDIVPEAVNGEKDAMAEETFYTEDDVETQGESPTKEIGDVKTYSSTKIDPQGIDQSKLVPLLVKTIQELEARITALES